MYKYNRKNINEEENLDYEYDFDSEPYTKETSNTRRQNRGTETREQVELDEVEECCKLNLPSLSVICGMTGTGKTTLLKWLILYNSEAFHKIYVLCPTAHLQDVYSFIPSRYLITNPTEVHIKAILKEQESNPKQRIAIVLDDCIGQVNFRNSKIFDKLASSGRHYRISTFILIQDFKKLSPTIRDNLHYLFITRIKEHSLKAAFELSSGFTSFYDFKAYMDGACKNYRVVRLLCAPGYEDKTTHVFAPGIPPKYSLSYK
jgi:hypothetical protein